jgi:hypothetical protein
MREYWVVAALPLTIASPGSGVISDFFAAGALVTAAVSVV